MNNQYILIKYLIINLIDFFYFNRKELQFVEF